MVYHLCVSQIDLAVLRKLIPWMAGDDAAHGAKIIGSSEFSIAGYVNRHGAKSGKITVKFAKLHVTQTLHGAMCVAAATPGKVTDSPYLGVMIALMPQWSGCILAYVQYGGMENCQAAKNSGCSPIVGQVGLQDQGTQRRSGDVEVP